MHLKGKGIERQQLKRKEKVAGHKESAPPIFTDFGFCGISAEVEIKERNNKWVEESNRLDFEKEKGEKMRVKLKNPRNLGVLAYFIILTQKSDIRFSTC